MTWARIDDRLYDDPRSAAAGPEAMGLWVLALSYMGSYDTDGWISLERVRRLVGPRRGSWLAARLVEVGWWERPDGIADAYRLIDWQQYLMSKDEAEQRRARAAAAGRRGGRRRSGDATPPPPPEGSTEGSDIPTLDHPESQPRANLGVYPGVQVGGMGGGIPRGSMDVPERNLPESFNSAQATRTRAPGPAPAPDPDPKCAHERACASAQDEDHGQVQGQTVIPFGPLDAVPATTTPLPASGKRPRKARNEAPMPTDAEREVFNGYLEGRKQARVTAGAAPVLDGKRLALIRQRLADGYRPEDLRAALSGIWRSDWHRQNDQCRADLALRDGEQIERFARLHAQAEAREESARRLAEAPPPPPRLPPVVRDVTPDRVRDLLTRYAPAAPEVVNG